MSQEIESTSQEVEGELLEAKPELVAPKIDRDSGGTGSGTGGSGSGGGGGGEPGRDGGSESGGAKDTGPSIAKTFGIVAILTVLSKFAGLARDVFVAMEYGTSVIADAYNYAYLFTGNILILFGGLGGPFHSATVSIVTPQKDNRNSGVLVCQLMALTTIVLTAITAIAYLAAPFVVHQMAAAYKPDVPSSAHSAIGKALMETANAMTLSANQQLFADQTLLQLQIMLPLIIISGLVGVSYGILNVYNKIFWPSLSPAIASLAIIAAIALTDPSQRLVWGVPLAVGTLAGAIGQLLAQLPTMLKLNLNWKLERTPQPGLSEYGKMLWPAVFSTSIGQLTVYVDSAFALSIHTQGAWTAIVNSNRLVQLPLGILLTAMLVPILPRFTEQVASNRQDDLKEELRRALRFLWFLSLPMTVILLVIPEPIIEVLFRRGNFTKESSDLVTAALFWLAPSIVFYVARDLMTRVFYAFQDSITPYRVAMLAIGVKALLDWFLVMTLKDVRGISLATTIITIFNLSLLTWFLRRKVGNMGFSKLVQPMVVMCAATVLCGAATWGIYHFLSAHIPADAMVTFVKLGCIGVSSILGLLLYTVFCILFRLDEPVMLAKRLPVVRNWV